MSKGEIKARAAHEPGSRARNLAQALTDFAPFFIACYAALRLAVEIVAGRVPSFGVMVSGQLTGGAVIMKSWIRFVLSAQMAYAQNYGQGSEMAGCQAGKRGLSWAATATAGAITASGGITSRYP